MIHHVFANRSNIGDWLSALGIQSLLTPWKVTEHLCDEPFVPATLKALYKATPEDLIVIGGGGLFMDYFAPFWEGFQEIAARVPFCIWGAGYCDHKRKASRSPEALLEIIVQQSQLCIVRDELSRQHLASCVLPPPVPCPSLGAVEPRPLDAYGLLHVDNFTIAGADVYEAMNGYSREFARCTQRQYRKTNNRIPAGNKTSFAETLKRYYLSDIVVSSALHGCIIAVAMGRKVVAVSGDYKVEAFMTAAGLGDWVLDIREVELLPERLKSLSVQLMPNEFLVRARRENQAVADRVLAVGGLNRNAKMPGITFGVY